ncbi:MAG: dTDP-4-dehydrorhamnose reductase [Haloplanus sp.]
MRLLVVGASGLLGSNVVAAATTRGWSVVGTYYSETPTLDVPLDRIDVTDDDDVRAVVRASDPECVINCAAMTDVDTCEEHPERAHEVNARAPTEMAAVCAAEGVKFVHVSTDYVFDGRRRTPYAEDADPNPVQIYGESKLAGERGVRDAGVDPFVVRPSFIYGVHQSTDSVRGFPAWLRGRLADGEQTSLFTDQFVTPTRAGHAAETILDLVTGERTGTYHVAARSCVTPFQFGVDLATFLGEDRSLVEPRSRTDVERTAQRPGYTCLDVSRVEAALGRPQPTLGDDLDSLSASLDSRSPSG